MDNPTDQHPEHPRKQWPGRITRDNMDYSSGGWATTNPAHWGGFSPWMHEYESHSDSDVDRPEPDVVLDDLASRRFRSPSLATPANYAIPMRHSMGTRAGDGLSRQQAAAHQATSWKNLAYLSSCPPSPMPGRLRPSLEDVPRTEELYEDSEDEEGEGEEGYADPVVDDLYTRWVGLSLQPSRNMPYDKFLPKYWTPEEDARVHKIKMGSQRRPWYRKMQGLSPKKPGSSSDDSDCNDNPWLGRPPP